MTSTSWPVIGCGVGLRSQHYPVITENWPKMDWFEAISENYMDTGGRPFHILENVRRHYPIALHGTALSLGSTDPINQKYLEKLKRLVERIDPFIVSDHLCWSGVEGEALHDLLPLPFTEEAIRHVVGRIELVQEFLGRRILVENVSTYVTFRHSVMPEWEFVTEVAKRSGCGILLDLNNLYVNATNHSFNPHEYLENIPGELVGQFHLAGHTDMGSFLFDTHSKPIIDSVWELYREALSLWGPVSTLVEWDENIPPFEELSREADKARVIYKQFERSGSKKHEGQTAVKQTINFSSHRSTTEVPLVAVEKWMQSRIHPKHKNEVKVLPWKLLNPQGGASGEERLNVYANGYTARVREALAEVYESIYHVLGADQFSALSDDYSVCYGTDDYNLNFIGRHLPGFLQTLPLKEDFPFLPDLARLEWLIWQAFHSFDEPPFTHRELASIPLEEWDNARMIFQPSVQVVASPWPILTIWRARHDSAKSSAIINALAHPERVLVSRKGDQVQCELLNEAQYTLLQGLLNGKSLGAVCEELAGTIGEEALPIDVWFSRWVNDGLIARLEFSGKTQIQAYSSS